MKSFQKMMLIIASLLIGSSSAFAYTFEDAKSCIIVYSKTESTMPNLLIACDGLLTIQDSVATLDQVEDVELLQEGLFLSFKNLVDPNNLKKCQKFDSKNMWYATCLSPKN
ncbi:MAG: hypothetical protein KDD45_12465 [Bdellovibrionales bacterium]|nr:hypothetical protein [Bdellovibrionales bacterium]